MHLLWGPNVPSKGSRTEDCQMKMHSLVKHVADSLFEQTDQ